MLVCLFQEGCLERDVDSIRHDGAIIQPIEWHLGYWLPMHAERCRVDEETGAGGDLRQCVQAMRVDALAEAVGEFARTFRRPVQHMDFADPA